MKKKMLSKIMVAICAGVMITGSLAGCGSNNTPAAEESAPAEATQATTEEAKETEEVKETAETAGGNEEITVSEETYEDPNGWSVVYDPNYISVASDNDITNFVYTGDSAGSNLVSVSYVSGKASKDVAKEFEESYGDTATTTETTFPGTEDVTAYYVDLPPAEGGSGLYESAIIRDYKDGSLVFEMICHNSGDEEMDMLVSDNLALIIDSVSFTE